MLGTLQAATEAENMDAYPSTDEPILGQNVNIGNKIESTSTEYLTNDDVLDTEQENETNEILDAIELSKTLVEFTWDDELLTESLDYSTGENSPNNEQILKEYPQQFQDSHNNNGSDYTDTDDENDLFAETLMYDSESIEDHSSTTKDSISVSENLVHMKSTESTTMDVPLLDGLIIEENYQTEQTPKDSESSIEYSLTERSKIVWQNHPIFLTWVNET